MFSDILKEIEKSKKRNSLYDFKSSDLANQQKANYVSDTNSKVSSDNKVKIFKNN